MADLNVERRGPSVWPWVIGLIVLALVAWLVVEMLGDDAEAERVEVEQVGTFQRPAVDAPVPGALT